MKDFWEYDSNSDIWTQKTDFGGLSRSQAVGFSIGSKGYIGTGYGDGIENGSKDFWVYTQGVYTPCPFNEPLVITCPGNQTLNVMTNPCAANYTIADPISDNCTCRTWAYVLSGATTGSVSGIANGTGSGRVSFNIGVTTVTLSGTDGTNTATTCSFTVTVNPYVISPSGNITYCPGSLTTTTLSIPPVILPPVTYNIAEANLINLPNKCRAGFYGYNEQVGFSWNDSGNGIVTNVQISFAVGVACRAGAHTTTFNSVATPGFTTAGWCSCSAPSTPQIFTINFSPTNYNVGGINTFLMNADAERLGLFPAGSLGGYYAQVTVTYGAPLILWSPGGQTTESITVSPSVTTTYTVVVTGNNGCSSTASKTITIEDFTPPNDYLPRQSNFKCDNKYLCSKLYYCGSYIR